MRFFIPGLLSLLGVATAFSPREETDSDVVTLTDATFYDFIENHDLVLANFYAPWCRYSKALAPEFEAAASDLKPLQVPLVKVDCTVESNICDDYDVRAYPTLKVFRGPDSYRRFSGNRQADS